MSAPLFPIGEFDLNDVRLNIGHVHLQDNFHTNKFILVEHQIDKDGKPIPHNIFDVQTMCYSLFSVPKVKTESGELKHYQIPRYIRDTLQLPDAVSNIHSIVGGGELEIRPIEKTVDLRSFSAAYGRELPVIRDRLRKQLREYLRAIGLEYNLGTEEPEPPLNEKGAKNLNPYWLRFKQAMAIVEPYLCPRDMLNKKIDCEMGYFELR